MTIAQNSPLYGQSSPVASLQVAIPIVQNRNPQATDINCPIGIRWINESTNAVFVLTNILTGLNGVSLATWEVEIGSISPLTEFIVDSGASPVTTTNNQVSFVGDNTKVRTTGGTGSIDVSLITPVSFNEVTLSGAYAAINFTDQSSSTASSGKIMTVSGSATVTSSRITTSSFIMVSPRGLIYAQANGYFTVITGTGGPYPPTEILYSYWIIN